MTENKEVCEITSSNESVLMNNSTFIEDLARHFHFTLGRDKVLNSHHYIYSALAMTIRDRLIAQWRATKDSRLNERRVSYISLEFLMGRTLNNAIQNLDLDDTVREALQTYCSDLEVVEDERARCRFG